MTGKETVNTEMTNTEAVRDYIERERERFLQDLVAFVSIPSVSTDPAHAADVREAARWVAGQLERAGLEPTLIDTDRHPLVYAEAIVDPSLPTLLVYGHFDVQPPDPLGAWTTPPFAATLRGSRLYGRGVSDDKAPMLIPIKVAEAYLQTSGTLPVNLKFLFEGEEEVGSSSLSHYVATHGEQLRADVVVSADGGMWRADVPSLTTSSCGLAALGFSLRGPATDLHSGRHGGGVANPLHAMARLVASLHDPDGRVAVAGFYDEVVPLTEARRSDLAALPFDEAGYLHSVGATEAFGEAGYSTLERQWHRPTLELNGLWGGYQGAGSKTVLPSEASAKITCRLVPGQQPHDIVDKIVRHLHAHCPPGVVLDVSRDRHGALPYQIADDHPALRVATEVLRDLYDRDPLVVGMGGSVPICQVFRDLLGIDTLFFSFAVGDENIHAPNEFFRVERFGEGLHAWAELFGRYAAVVAGRA